ncbi:metalloregulator ArsR/SmtB family transcription factor [Parvibaculum sp.]|jgi:DNA-binding transcriptional ArsR family regulator|uniref:ArsR/SmtB family transcription factor n=1 Tax=Parvibaculum sp. TaxID=2024848 RepID=UPI0032989A48
METFAALADPTRRQIVEMLAAGELAAGDIASRFKMSAPAVSQHLKTLKSARLVRVRVDAQRRIYSLDPEGIESVEAWLANIRRFWGPKLDALESALKAAAERDKENDGN